MYVFEDQHMYVLYTLLGKYLYNIWLFKHFRVQIQILTKLNK